MEIHDLPFVRRLKWKNASSANCLAELAITVRVVIFFLKPGAVIFACQNRESFRRKSSTVSTATFFFVRGFFSLIRGALIKSAPPVAR